MIKLAELKKYITIVKIIGDENYTINNIYPLPEFRNELENISGALYWVNDKNIHCISNILSGAIICSKEILKLKLNSNCTYILVDNPRYSFKEVAKVFSQIEPLKFSIAKSSLISAFSFLGEQINIGNNVIVEDYCRIGSNTRIGHNTVILKNTIIGDNVQIGCNCTIGGVGFGYEKNEDGNYEVIPHLGNVLIKNNVEIGNNVAIDRAALGSTIIEENVKIDNLVHIAHGVKIGKNSLIIANAMIAGSVIIGENVWVAPSSSIMNGIKIGNSAVIGMGAVVLKEVERDKVIVGNPGKVLNRS